ncbi:sterol desaturase family protein [Flavobacteriaceae bacterium]|nr:sterol desaturase family protein [Flavobacteriaceae bacterium]
MDYIQLFIDAFLGTLKWTWRSIIFDVPWQRNYFWGLIVISIAVFALEIMFPWRKGQKIFRKDFWLDGFYMFFNFFIFSVFISGFYKCISKFSTDVLALKMTSLSIIDLSDFQPVVQLLLFFVVLDFVQWFTHTLLHRYDLLWKFHKVHHSVKEMGFAAHLRYHWMENILYKPLKVLALMLLGGFQPEQAYVVHFLAIAIGHLNHANLKLDYGPLKYILNNPIMHLYHHAYSLPESFKNGANFAISLSLWDFIFKTNYVPKPDKNLRLGYSDDAKMPKSFWGQLRYGFRKDD